MQKIKKIATQFSVLNKTVFFIVLLTLFFAVLSASNGIDVNVNNITIGECIENGLNSVNDTDTILLVLKNYNSNNNAEIANDCTIDDTTDDTDDCTDDDTILYASNCTMAYINRYLHNDTSNNGTNDVDNPPSSVETKANMKKTGIPFILAIVTSLTCIGLLTYRRRY